MRINNKARAGLVAGAAIAAMAVAGIAGSTLANAADSSTGSTSGTSKMARTASEPLTGATADSVKAAVLAKYPGATVNSMEKETHGTSIYEAHITKADGTKAHVLVDANFALTGEHAAPTKGSHGGRGGKGARSVDEALTGATAASVKAAVLAKYPGATVDSMEKETHGTSIYEAHITKADGTKAHVLVDANFAVTGEHAAPTKGSHGRKDGKGHRGGKHGAATSNGSSGSASGTSGNNA